ncbi:hypothetical protein L3i22_027180 [Actinoplanes sp. L3-i22]|nr:hypothetical protein L3i22_027180 [Actinoplanes sp. L3-i22]
MPPGRPRWTDPAESRPGQLTWQLITVWLLGGCAPFVLDGVAHGFELGGPAFTTATVAMLVVIAAGLITMLYLLVRATSLVTPLGGTRRRRLLWAALVAAGGGLAWLTGRTVATAHGLDVLHNGRLAVLLGGALAALVAAALTRGWWLRAPATAALVVLAATGVLAFRDTGPSELDQRLARAGWTRDAAWHLDVPGFRPVRSTFGLAEQGDEYVPTDPAAAGRITLLTIDVSTGCHPPRCTDQNYLLLGGTNRASVFTGDTPRAAIIRNHHVLELTGNPDVPPELLRQALASARPATDTELLDTLPAYSPRNPVEAARAWLRRHT